MIDSPFLCFVLPYLELVFVFLAWLGRSKQLRWWPVTKQGLIRTNTNWEGLIWHAWSVVHFSGEANLPPMPARMLTMILKSRPNNTLGKIDAPVMMPQWERNTLRQQQKQTTKNIIMHNTHSSQCSFVSHPHCSWNWHDWKLCMWMNHPPPFGPLAPQSAYFPGAKAHHSETTWQWLPASIGWKRYTQ